MGRCTILLVDNRRTIERLAAKFGETESVAIVNKGCSSQPCLVKTSNNVQNLREQLEESPLRKEFMSTPLFLLNAGMNLVRISVM